MSELKNFCTLIVSSLLVDDSFRGNEFPVSGPIFVIKQYFEDGLSRCVEQVYPNKGLEATQARL